MNTCYNSRAFEISEYTDFYSCKNHALNASKIIRGENAELSRNWYNLPVAYNGRASSIVITDSDIRRPTGQIYDQDNGIVKFEPTKKLDFELEMGGQDWVTDFNPGYFKRGNHLFPRQGSHSPWHNTQDYLLDLKMLAEGLPDDGV